jgi:hypothetical protein
MLVLLEILATTRMAVKRENGREKRCHPKGVKADLRRSQVKHLSSGIAVLDVEAWNMGSTIVVPLKHLVDLYQSSSRSKNKESQHKSHLTTEHEAQKYGRHICHREKRW